MSVVNNYVLKLNLLESIAKQFVLQLNRTLLELMPGQGAEVFRRVDQYAGGPKNMEVHIYLAALNYIDPTEVSKILSDAVQQDHRHLRMCSDKDIQLFCQQQHNSEDGLFQCYP